MDYNRLIVALDFPDTDQAINFARQLDPQSCRIKIGKELFTRGGPAVVEALKQLQFDIFLDLKFHDIPNTVAKACLAACDLGVWMVNMHTLGGVAMLSAASAALEAVTPRPLLIGVTILTSHSEESIHAIGLSGTIEQNIVHLASQAREAGLQGVVCSAQDVQFLKNSLPADWVYVTPGIRPLAAATHDQHRVMTPYDAMRNGSTYLVMGRPVIKAADPMKVIETVNRDIKRGLLAE